MEKLFDEFERSETRTKHERESTFEYYNSSARAPIAALRGFLERWFESYPAHAKAHLRGLFRSRIDFQHSSAFWELYLHEIFTRMGYALEPHPTLMGSPNHPDYLVSENGSPSFYLEAILAGLPSVKDAAAEARLAEVFDLINKLESPEYFLWLEYRGRPQSPPPIRGLRKTLEEWLGSLDIDALKDAYSRGEFAAARTLEWRHEALTLFFRPIPKHSAGASARPIAVTMEKEMQILETDQDIREAVEKKAKKYGELPHPLVVAANVLSEHCDDIDIFNALFGSEMFQVAFHADGSETTKGGRLPNGVWFGKRGPRNQVVSAVLIGNRIDPYTVGTTTPILIHNPYTQSPLSLPEYPLPQALPDNATRRVRKTEGRRASEFLRLPSPWPPSRLD